MSNQSKKRLNLAEKNPINLALARKVADIVSKGLTSGMDDGTTDEAGNPVPGHMCVEAAVSFACGEDHDDHPKCVARFVADYKIGLNDEGTYKSKKDRGECLRRIAVAQLGSKQISHSDWEEALGAAVEAHIPTLAVRLKQWGKNYGNEKLAGVLISALNAVGEKRMMEALDELNSNGVDGMYYICPLDCQSVEAIINLWGDDRKGTLAAIEIGIDALRRCKSPGIKLMDKLIAEGVI
jgi:hypothetical protein